MSNFRPLQIEDIPEGSEHGSLAHSESTEVAARRDADILEVHHSTLRKPAPPTFLKNSGPSNES